MLYTISWIFLASPRTGLLDRALEPVAGPGAIEIFGPGGMVLVEGFHLAPLVFLLMVASFRRWTRARGVGDCERRTAPAVFRRVTLPLVRPRCTRRVLISPCGRSSRSRRRRCSAFRAASGSSPRGSGARSTRTRPTSARRAHTRCSLLALTAIGVFLLSRLSRARRRFQTVTGRAAGGRSRCLGRWRWPARGGRRLLRRRRRAAAARCSSTRRRSRSTRRPRRDARQMPASRTTAERPRPARSRFAHSGTPSCSALAPRRSCSCSRRRGLARRAHAPARPLAARWPRVPADRRPGARARRRAALRLPPRADRRSTARSGSCSRVLDGGHAVRDALRVGVDAPDRRRARGVRAVERRELVADVPAVCCRFSLPGLLAGWIYIFVVVAPRAVQLASCSTRRATRCCRSGSGSSTRTATSPSSPRSG